MQMPNNVLQVINNLIPNLSSMQEMQNVNSPDEFAQMLLNSGKVNQGQVNQAKQMWNQPNIRQMIRNKYGI